MLLCYLSVVAWPAISRHFTRCSHSNWGSRLFPFHGGFQGGRGLVSAAPAEPPNLLPPSGGEQTKTVIFILQDVPSPVERTESKMCWDIKDRTMGAARCSSCHMEKIEFQRHKLPSKASCWKWTEKLILSFNLGLLSSAGLCCLSLHLKMKRKP